MTHSGTEAAALAQRVGYPVVVKSAVPGIVHKSEQRLVHPGRDTASAVRDGVRELHKATGGGHPCWCSGPPPGTEIPVGAFQDERFGPM